MRYIPWNENRAKELVDIWNRELEHDFPMRTSLFLQNSFEDENVLQKGSWIAVNDDDQAVGFVIAKVWQENMEDMNLGKNIGWIQALLVHSDYRHQGVGSTLMEKAEQALKKRNVEKIILGRDPWHYFPGIPKNYENVKRWFESKNYSQYGSEHDLYLLNNNNDEYPLPEKEGVQFRLLREDEGNKLVEFLHRCFPGRWEYEAIHYVKREGSGREFVIVEKDDRIIGFCRINDASSPFIAQNVYWSPLFEQELGGIGPLGVDREERKNGYGLAVVQAGMHFLHQRGIKQIVIDWTGLVSFYQKLGYNVWKSYDSYAKQLT